VDEKGQAVSNQCPDFAFKKREREHHPRIAFRSSDSSDSEVPEEYDNQTKDPFQKVVEASCRPLTFISCSPVQNQIKWKKPEQPVDLKRNPAVSSLRRYHSYAPVQTQLLPLRRELKIRMDESSNHTLGKRQRSESRGKSVVDLIREKWDEIEITNERWWEAKALSKKQQEMNEFLREIRSPLKKSK